MEPLKLIIKEKYHIMQNLQMILLGMDGMINSLTKYLEIKRFVLITYRGKPSETDQPQRFLISSLCC
jgi:hypothetical protein